MFKCVLCGLENPSESARFCTECGPDAAAKDWAPGDIDQPLKVTQYVSMLSELYFDSQSEAEVEKFSLRARQRLKISYDTHSSVLGQLVAQKKAIAHLANFRFEFNQNVTDAYAGHDTFLSFRYTNQSDDDLFKVDLVWDDPETTDRIDLKAQTKSFVKPQSAVTIGGAVIFERIGIKEISDLQITITDQFGESAIFRAESFSFKIGDHEQRVTQNISTHNQISIEGRGVVDASGLGADKASIRKDEDSNQPHWKELRCSYVPKQQPVAPATSFNEKFDEDDPVSVRKAAENGIADAQNTLGDLYLNGQGVAPSDEQAVYWYRKGAEQGNAAAQNGLGFMYRKGRGVAQSDEQAVHWFQKAAAQGDATAQNNLGLMYRKGRGVAQSDQQAVHWYRKGAEQGNAAAQNGLGFMYTNGRGVAQSDEQAVHWYQKAAKQGNAAAQNDLGFMYLNGLGVAQIDEQAVHWYRKAAEQGNAVAQNSLAFMYAYGRGVAQSDEQAVHWYRKAAEQGDADAQNDLGFMYANGRGVAQSDEQAVHWYRKAAEQGNIFAIESLKGCLNDSNAGV